MADHKCRILSSAALVLRGLAVTMGKKGSGEGLMDVSNLAKEWDESETIRDRLREGLDLLHPDSGPSEDINTVLLNKELVTPMIVRMAAKPEKKPHPQIESLTEEVSTVFSLNKRVPLPAYSDLRALAWRLRWLCGFVKSKARRKEPSTDTLRQLEMVDEINARQKQKNLEDSSGGAKSVPAGDTVETQPIDILTAAPPDPPPDKALSPLVPSSEKRETFQRKRCPKSTTKPVTLDREVGKTDKKEEPPEDFTPSEDEAHMGPYFEPTVKATRQKQLTIREKDPEDSRRGRGRGRGKGKGRGRGGNGGESKRSPSQPKLKATSSKEPHKEKKRKTATMKRPAKSSDIPTPCHEEGNEEWAEDECWADEWQDHWEEEWGDEWDHESWGSNGKDWDRYAWTAGQEALQQLASGSTPSSGTGASKESKVAKKQKGKANPEQAENNTEHTAAKKRRKLDSEVKPKAETKVKKNQAKAVEGEKPAKKSKGTGSTKKVSEAPAPVPKSKKALVKMLVDFGMQFIEVADSDAKEAMKPLLAKPRTCRLNIYWDKRSAVAVHSHHDKCDFAQFRFQYEHLSWACRMAARYVDEISETIEEETGVAEDTRVTRKKDLLTECGNLAVAELGYCD
eukprot:s32_g34.t1